VKRPAVVVVCGVLWGLFSPAWARADEPSRGAAKTPMAFPGRQWREIAPAQAGFDVARFDALLARADIRGGTWGGVPVADGQWGAVLTRGGYVVRRWGNTKYLQQSASLGKCITRALFGLSVEAGVLTLPTEGLPMRHGRPSVGVDRLVFASRSEKNGIAKARQGGNANAGRRAWD